MEKSAHKLELQKRIADLEAKELWHLDVEDDPETYPLMPDQVDYLNEKLSSKASAGTYPFPRPGRPQKLPAFSGARPTRLPLS